MKKASPTHVLLAGTSDELAVLSELASGLRRLGHTVAIALNTEEALGQPTPNVLVVTEAAGSSLFQAFNLPTGSPRGVFLSKSQNFDAASQATRHGADEVLGTPTIDQLAEAVERKPRASAAFAARELELNLSAQDRHRGMLELLAFTTHLGLERSLRLRIATAASELVTTTTGPVTLSVCLAGDPIGIDRLVLEMTDFEGELVTHEDERLDFARALSERLDVTTDGASATVRLEFVMAPANFDEDPAGLDNLDYFDPVCLRELHAVLGDAAEGFGSDLHRLAPAAAATLLRIASAQGQPETALFPASAESSI